MLAVLAAPDGLLDLLKLNIFCSAFLSTNLTLLHARISMFVISAETAVLDFVSTDQYLPWSFL